MADRMSVPTLKKGEFHETSTKPSDYRLAASFANIRVAACKLLTGFETYKTQLPKLAIAGVPVPVIARIEGMCIGAGLALALACGLRFAAPGATFAITPAKLGRAYSLTDTRRLQQAVGISKAKELLFTGERIDAVEALRIGLISAIGDATSVRAKTMQIAANSSESHVASKEVTRLIEQNLAGESETSRSLFTDAPQSADFREGLASFRAKRPPPFPARPIRDG